MKYIFLYRRITDIDHTVPIIYSLLKNGINHSQIIYTDQNIDKTTLNITKDHRIKFLNNYKIRFNQSFFINIYSLKKLFKSKNIFFKKLLNLIFYITNKLINFFFFIKLLKFIIFFRNKKIIVDSLNNKFLEKIANILNVELISIPHGIVFHNGDIKNNITKNLRFRLPNLFDYKFYKKLFFYNNHSLDVNNLYIKNLRITGSARYCREWINVQKNIYPKLSRLFLNNKPTILLLLEKNNYFYNKKKIINVIDPNELIKLIKFLNNQSTFNVIIKTHPSYKINNIKLQQNNKLLIIKSDYKYKTYQLVDYADVILGFKSGAICDAIVQNKFFLILDYCQIYELIIKKFLHHQHFASSYKDFIFKINNYKNYKMDSSDFINNYIESNLINVLDKHCEEIIK